MKIIAQSYVNVRENLKGNQE